MQFWIAVNSQTIYYTAIMAASITITGSELFAVNILYHSAYLMYRCYLLKPEISKQRSEYFYSDVTLALLDLFSYVTGFEKSRLPRTIINIKKYRF